MLSAQKLSISISPSAFAYIDTYRQKHNTPSRSQVVNEALRLLEQHEQTLELDAAYSQSAASDTLVNAEFEASNLDGLAHEAW